MPAAETRTGLLTFAILAAGAAANLLVMQDKPRGSGVETSAITRGAAARATGEMPAATADVATADAGAHAGQPAHQKIAAVAPGADTTVNKAEIIRGVQRELNTRGYGTGQPDGVAGLLTRASIMAYEYDYGLSLTAEPTQELLSRIVLGSSAPPAGRGAGGRIGAGEAESVVVVVKQQLAALGYTPGKADGKLTEQTARAIREFEVDQKLPESGRISGPLVSRLMRLQGSGVAAAAKTKSAQK